MAPRRAPRNRCEAYYALRDKLRLDAPDLATHYVSQCARLAVESGLAVSDVRGNVFLVPEVAR